MLIWKYAHKDVRECIIEFTTLTLLWNVPCLRLSGFPPCDNERRVSPADLHLNFVFKQHGPVPVFIGGLLETWCPVNHTVLPLKLMYLGARHIFEVTAVRRSVLKKILQTFGYKCPLFSCSSHTLIGSFSYVLSYRYKSVYTVGFYYSFTETLLH